MTPLMEQYSKIKSRHKDAMLLFRLGDFYEMFYEDAKTASKVLGIALTSRAKGENRIPMAGVPYHSANTYINRLLKAGHKVAICEQMEDAGDAVGIVDRDVVRVITPGTLIDEGILESRKNNYLAAVYLNGVAAGISWIDISTGKFFVQDMSSNNVLNSLACLSPSECILPMTTVDSESGLGSEIKNIVRGTITPYPDWTFDRENAYKSLTEHFNTSNLAGFGCEELGPSLSAAGAIISYLNETHKSALKHITKVRRHISDGTLLMDRHTFSSLELTTVVGDGKEDNSLFGVIDRTVTPMGTRLLREWVLAPLNKVEGIKYRQEGVGYLVGDVFLREDIRALFKKICDIERITAKIGSGRANARDLVALRNSLVLLPALKEKLQGVDVPILSDICGNIDSHSEIGGFLSISLIDEPPHLITEGGIIKNGFDEELDKVRTIATGGKDWLARFQIEEIKRTGIQSLKIGFNRVFGYYIEITNVHKDKIPQNYIRKQTLKNAERFITSELKDYETQVLNSQDRIKELEYELFLKIRDRVTVEIPKLQKTAAAIAELDALASLAQIAQENNYINPVVDNSLDIEIIDGRHPVLDKVLSGKFIPNDTKLNDLDRILMITGPNMAGKSTYIRQVALITLLAQMGSFVPAKEARIGIVDKIFTRIGASDELAKGASTFMVEMNETANILNNATERSLIILDEIGRGTSTFDGVSIAWAVTEFLHSNIKARTLFATHYHELTELGMVLKGIKNLRVAVKEWGDSIIFLHKIEEGGADKSYGIYVARLAGIPGDVVKRAKEILANLESMTLNSEDMPRFERKETTKDKKQIALFSRPTSNGADQLHKDIISIDVNNITPIDALNKLRELREKTIKSDEGKH